MRVSAFVAAVFAAGGAVVDAVPTKPNHGPSGKPPSLYKAIQKRGREFVGTALTLRDIPKELAIIDQEFNSITPENAQKWESIQPSQGNFTFAEADRHVAFAKANKLQMHCHTLVWHSQLPAWVSAGGFDNATLIKVMEEHIKTVAGRYEGACNRWDVVNEALNEDGTYRKSVWLDTIGESYLPIAFSLAAKYAPRAKLFYNDYNLDANGPKTEGARRIVRLIQSYGLRIDGVGFQAHLTGESTPSNKDGSVAQVPMGQLVAALRDTAKLGVNVAYTELDIRFNTPATNATLAAQAVQYERVASACMAVRRCIGITVWGTSDRYSWIPGVFPGEGASNVWDENYDKKPAYAGFLRGIQGR